MNTLWLLSKQKAEALSIMTYHINILHFNERNKYLKRRK